MDFKELIESRQHNYIGSKAFDNICEAIELKRQIQDGLNINIHVVPQVELDGNQVVFAYFTDDIPEDKIDRATEILKIWNGEHDEFYDDICGKYASPEMIQAITAGGNK